LFTLIDRVQDTAAVLNVINVENNVEDDSNGAKQFEVADVPEVAVILGGVLKK